MTVRIKNPRDSPVEAVYREFMRADGGSREFAGLIEKVRRGEHLVLQDATLAMGMMADDERVTDAQIGAFLVALHMKGETADELAGFATAMVERSTRIRLKNNSSTLGDTCGTGGGKTSTYNVSTTCAFVLAAGGLTIAKHGNRAVLSRCGSADVLEALGAEIELEPEQVGECIDRIGIGFLYAPKFHRAFDRVKKVRKELHIRTVFNVLGPLVNPAGAKRQVLGVMKAKYLRPTASALKKLGRERAWVVYAWDDLDEISTLGATEILDVAQKRPTVRRRLMPKDAGINRAANIEDIQGGPPEMNAEILRSVLNGTATPAQIDLTVLNAAAGFVVFDKANDIAEGVEMSRQIIAEGKAYKKLEEFIQTTQELKNRKN